MAVAALAVMAPVGATLAGATPVGDNVAASAIPALPETDRVRIAEAFRIADALGQRVWPHWDEAPFAVLLVTPEHEFLIRHPSPTSDFTLVGEDALLKQKVWVRKRQFATDLLATFPAVAGVSTIVIGQAEATESKTSSRWVITLLHEHFHQYQDSRPGNDAAVNALGLARGDTTGMWMLNYPFPYADPKLGTQFQGLGRALVATLDARGRKDFQAKLLSLLATRERVYAGLAPDDRRYLAFQIWKEGIARYSEYQIASLAASDYEPSASFSGLKDFRPFQAIADGILSGIERELAQVQLEKSKRSVVYSLGAAEGLVLDAARPDWRALYFEERFSLDRLFTADPGRQP
jgi:hypothetical protein